MDFQEAVDKLKNVLNTKQGRVAVVLGTMIGVSMFLGYLGSGGPETPVKEKRKEYKSLIDEKTRKLYLQDLKAEQEQTKKQVGVLQEQILKLKEQIEKSLSEPQEPKQPQSTQNPSRQSYVDNRLINELRALRKTIDTMNRRIDRIEQKVQEKTAPISPEQVTRYSLPRVQPPKVRTVKPGQSSQENGATLLEGFYPAEEDKEVEKLFKQMSHPEVCLPQGSFGKVVALSGLSAPTGPRAAQDPVPVLFVIPGEFIKPNIRRTYKLRNCFAIGWGAGDLSSERIKVKVRSISCELQEGKPITFRTSGYIAGPDGKEGIKGILVEKRGQYLAKALMASFAEGLSAIARYSTAVVSISPLGATQTVPPEKAFKYGFGLGVEKALSKLSDYYLQLADEVLPVIEVGSGVSGTLIMLQPACEDEKRQKPWAVAVEETKQKLAQNPIKQQQSGQLQKQIEEVIKPFYGGVK